MLQKRFLMVTAIWWPSLISSDPKPNGLVGTTEGGIPQSMKKNWRKSKEAMVRKRFLMVTAIGRPS